MAKRQNQSRLFAAQEEQPRKNPIQPMLDGFSETEKLFYERLPKRPYCTDDCASGLIIRPAVTAIQFRYLQINPPFLVHHAVYDIDQGEESCYAWQTANLPEPNVTLINPANGNCHSIYTLAAPVLTTDFASEKPIKYLHAISLAYRELLHADCGFSGLIAKNLFHKSWLRGPSHRHLFSLEELAKHVDLRRFQASNINYATEGLGRNCTVFNLARKWAYVAIRSYRGDRSSECFHVWCKEVLKRCESFNGEFPSPMQFNEVRHIAKSIAKWTWVNDPKAEQEFLVRQSFKGKKSGEARRKKRLEAVEAALLLSKQGISDSEIAQKLSVGRSTVWRWKVLHEPKSDNSAFAEK